MDKYITYNNNMYVYGMGNGNIFLDEEVKNDHQIYEFYITFTVVNLNVWFNFFFYVNCKHQ